MTAADLPSRTRLPSYVVGGPECNGKDPERYGCAEKVWTAAMRKVGETYVQLRYRPTCQAAWGRIVHADVYTPMVDAPSPAPYTTPHPSGS